MEKKDKKVDKINKTKKEDLSPKKNNDSIKPKNHGKDTFGI